MPNYCDCRGDVCSCRAQRQPGEPETVLVTGGRRIVVPGTPAAKADDEQMQIVAILPGGQFLGLGLIEVDNADVLIAFLASRDTSGGHGLSPIDVGGPTTRRRPRRLRSRRTGRRVASTTTTSRTAREVAEMARTRALLIERLSDGQGIETSLVRGVLRASLRPFAELMLIEIVEIAERPGMPLKARELLVRKVMADAGA